MASAERLFQARNYGVKGWVLVNILLSDSSGGVKSVSVSLSDAFNKAGIPNSMLNLKERSRGFLIDMLFAISWARGKKKDVFILQHFDAIFLGLILRLLGFVKLINVVHIDLVYYYQSAGFIKRFVIWCVFYLIRDGKVVFVSKEAELKAKVFFKLSDTDTIYNICNFDYIRRPDERCKRVVVLGSVSRLHTVKNIDLTIRVVRELRNRGEEVRLLIYGDGEHADNLKGYIEKLGCGGFVELVGSSSDKSKMYCSIDALISFSSIEGLPTVILESIAFGKPVLYTDCSSGPRELMVPGANPLEKTNSYERTDVGYLVKPAKEVATYSESLTSYEREYVSIVDSFVRDVRENKFKMEYDASPFSEKVVLQKWLVLVDNFC